MDGSTANSGAESSGRDTAAHGNEGDPLEPLVIAIQEAVASGGPLPAIDEDTLSEADRSRLQSFHSLIDSLHRLRESNDMTLRETHAVDNEGPGANGGEKSRERRGGTSREAEDSDGNSHQTLDAANLAGLASPGRHLGRFRIERLLGHGGHGVVYLAFDSVLNRLVALKIPRPEVLVDRAMRERFLLEARSAATLDHANIVPVYEAGAADGVLYIAMAYCPGDSLAEFFEKHRGTLSPRAWAKLFRQLAGALAYTHERGILHRDLKPGNILLFPINGNSDGVNTPHGDGLAFVPKLTDFGVATIIEESARQTRTTLGGGTPLYMSPEQTAPKGKIDARSDVHCLGAVMYETLTGQAPYGGESLLALLEAIRHRLPPAPHRVVPSIPRDLSTICLKCLEKRPQSRYASAAALAADLERFLNHEPIRAKPTSWPEQLFLWCQRRPAIALSIAFTTLAIMAGLMGFLLHWKQTAYLTALNRASEYNRLVGETETLTARPHVGWSWAGLDKLRETLAHDVAPGDIVKLRSAAAAFLSGTDLQRVATIAPGIRGQCLEFSPGGNQLAVGENNNQGSAEVPIEVWDFESRTRQWRLTFPVGHVKPGQPDGVRSLIFSHSGRWLIAGSRQGAVHAWDLETSPPKRRGWQLHGGWVTGLAELDNGEIISASDDGAIRHIRLDGDNLSPAHKFGERVSNLRAGVLRLSDGTRKPILVATINFVVRVLSPADGMPAQEWQPPLPDGEFLGPIIDHGAVLTAHGRSVKLLDLEFGNVLRGFQDPDIAATHDGEVRSLDLSPDESVLATGASDGRVKLWDMATGSLLCNLFLSTQDNIALRFHPGGRFLAVANGIETHILEVQGGDCTRLAVVQRSPITGVGISQGNLVTTGRPLPQQARSELSLNATGAGATPTIRGYHSDLTSFSLNNQTENRADTLICAKWEQPVSLALHPRRAICGYSCSNHEFVELHLEDRHRELFQEELQAIGFSADGQYLWATYSVKPSEFDKSVGAVGAWRLTDLSKAGEWFNRESKRLGKQNGLYNLCVGKSLLAVGSTDGSVKLLSPDPAHLKLIGTVAIEDDEVSSLALDPTETLLAIGTRRGRLVIFHTRENRKICELQSDGDEVSTVAFSGDGRLLATGSHDHVIRLRAMRGDLPEEVFSLPRQSNRILKVVFGPHDDTLYALVHEETAIRTFAVKWLHAELRKYELGFDWNGAATPAIVPHGPASTADQIEVDMSRWKGTWSQVIEGTKGVPPLNISETSWGVAGRYAFPFAARTMLARSPVSQKLEDQLTFALRQQYGDLVDRIRIHWDATPLDHWGEGQFTIALGSTQAIAQTYGYDIYVRWKSTDQPYPALLQMLGHELAQARQFELYNCSYAEIGDQYFRNYRKANLVYARSPMEIEVHEAGVDTMRRFWGTILGFAKAVDDLDSGFDRGAFDFVLEHGYTRKMICDEIETYLQRAEQSTRSIDFGKGDLDKIQDCIRNASLCIQGQPRQVKVGQHLSWAHEHSREDAAMGILADIKAIRERIRESDQSPN
jgi:serine/threonine protein kinase/WD40 repeat protein